ncbi:dTDP-4-dehydrorhamnose 3,5-epimerase [Rhodobacterales bacterium]|nr:dTDP-4-dehydrorhamnose 3,5-epimerase [Rhodobacterales bacterium]
MRVEQTEIPGVLLLTPRAFLDSRGYFTELYNQRVFHDLGIECDFVQDNMSFSKHAGTVRGLHYQAPPFAQAKLVRCVRGEILDVCVDIRIGSPTYGATVSRILSARNMCQIFVPAGFAHGFSTLSPLTEVHYKVDNPYAPECERGIRFDDPQLAIDWQLEDRRAVISDKDTELPDFASLVPEFFHNPENEESRCAS